MLIILPRQMYFSVNSHTATADVIGNNSNSVLHGNKCHMFRRWCRQWTTCSVLTPWSHGRTWTSQSRPTPPPCYWMCWRRALSCWPTTCMEIAFLTVQPTLVRTPFQSSFIYSSWGSRRLSGGCWQCLCLFLPCAFRSWSPCFEHRDGPAGLVLPTELFKWKHHPALRVHH